MMWNAWIVVSWDILKILRWIMPFFGAIFMYVAVEESKNPKYVFLGILGWIFYTMGVYSLNLPNPF